MEKRSKNGVLVTTIITLTLLALLNIFTFVVPFDKHSTVSHFVNYGMATFVLVAQGVVFAVTMFGEHDPKQRVMGLPIVYSGFVTLGAQLILTFIFFLINGFVELAPWIVIVVEALVIAYLVINVAKGFFFKSHSKAFAEADVNTKFMVDFRARLKALVAINPIESMSRELEDLYETARGSDPVSSEITLESESELLSLLQELDRAVKAGNETDARNALTNMKNTLIERNALCKTRK